ncbi:MAG: ABC transporter substrate-binding protein [Hungatella hathewayi]|nr:ABC transporter substrate-binding protein [Hungatella hathewayi]
MRRNNLLRKTAAYSLAIAMLAAGALTGCSKPAGETSPATEAPVTTEAPKESETQTEVAKTEETTGAQVAEAVSKVENKTGEKIRVGYDIYFLGNSWSVQLYQEFKWNAENMYKDDLDVTYVQSDNDVSKQIANLEDLIAQDVDVIITTPCDTTAINSTLEEAVDAGIKVVLLCATVDGDCYDSLVTVDEKDFGATGAQWLVDQLDGKGNIVVLNGISGFSTNTLRYEGAQSVFEKYPDIKVLAAEDANWDYAAAKTVTTDLLATYPEIDGVWSQGGAMTLGAIDSFNAAKRDLVPMTGEDNNGYLKACINNNMEGIAVSKPTWLARVAIENAIKLMNGEEVKKDDIYPVMTIKTEEMPEYVHQDLSDDVWCGTELPEDVLKSVFSN